MLIKIITFETRLKYLLSFTRWLFAAQIRKIFQALYAGWTVVSFALILGLCVPWKQDYTKSQADCPDRLKQCSLNAFGGRGQHTAQAILPFSGVCTIQRLPLWDFFRYSWGLKWPFHFFFFILGQSCQSIFTSSESLLKCDAIQEALWTSLPNNSLLLPYLNHLPFFLYYFSDMLL